MIYNNDEYQPTFTSVAESITQCVIARDPRIDSHVTEIALESDISDENLVRLQNSETSLSEVLQDANFTSYIKNMIGSEDESNPRYIAAMDAARGTLMASGDLARYHRVYGKQTADVGGNARMLFPDSAEELPQEIALESFDSNTLTDYIGVSVVANATLAATNPVAELFMPTKVLSASQQGAFIDVSNPVVYQKVPRLASGKEYQLEKTSAVRAMVDPSILGANYNKIWPIATAAKADQLVSTTVVANTNITIGGITVPVRPILFGQTVDLLAMSANEALLESQVMDEEDTLDPVNGFGDVYVKLTIDTTDAVFVLKTKDLPGALLQPTQEGSTRDLQGVFSGNVVLRSTDTAIGGATLAATFTTLASTLGATGAYRLFVNLDLSGSISLTKGNAKFAFVSATVANAFDDVTGEYVAATNLSSAQSAVAIEGVGYIPDSRRSNSNMRQTGDIIDMSDTYRVCIPAIMKSPWTMVKPVDEQGNGLTILASQVMSRIRTSNQSIGKIVESFETISSSSGILGGTMSVGQRAGIVPVAISKTFNILEMSTNDNRSDLAMTSAQGAICSAVAMLAQTLIKKADYLASLFEFSGSQQNFEFIVGTDPQIYSLMMLQGENRTFGLDQRFKIAPSVDKRLKDTIYISVRRTDVNEPNPHTFGCHVMKPAVVHQANVSSGGSTDNRTIYIPREGYGTLCPIIGKITVEGMDTLFFENN